jgi:hypothetical protein
VLPCVDVFVADEFCVWATILRTCLALCWGAQLADVLTCLALRTCLAFALRMCVGAPNLSTCLVLHWGAQLADLSRVSFGRLTCGRALRCIGAPNFGEAILKTLPPSGAFGRPTCGCALHYVGAPNLRTCEHALCLHCGRAFGHPTCRRALRCVGVPNLRTCLALCWGAQPW